MRGGEESQPTRPLRITHLITNAEFAGTERYVVDVTRILAERGHDVTVIGGRADTVPELLPPEARWRPGHDTRSAVRELVRGGRRDIVHSHLAKSDFVAVLAAPVTGGSRVSTRHITAPRGFTPKARRLAPVVRRLLACELAVSRWTSGQLDHPADRILLNGVRSQPAVSTEREHVVLLAQRLDPEKDTATALHAWARSGLAERGWTLHVAGSGSESAALQALSTELGTTDSVQFLGWLSDVETRYRSSAIFLAPAPTEPCGLSVLEAMANGLPVVAAAAGGVLETVGLHPEAEMFPAGDADAAAAALSRLADDAGLRARYGASLRELQQRSFTIEGHVDQLEQVYVAAARQPERRGATNRAM